MAMIERVSFNVLMASMVAGWFAVYAIDHRPTKLRSAIAITFLCVDGLAGIIWLAAYVAPALS